MGGHNVPEEIVRRRYNKGIRNFSGFTSHWQIRGSFMIIRLLEL